MRWLLKATLGAFLVGVGLLPSASHAATPECGKPAKRGGDPVRGALTLRQDLSVTELNFKRDTAERRITLEFGVGNCLLYSAQAIKVRTITSNLPKDAFGEPIITPKAEVLSVELPVRTTFSPGEYTFFIAVSGRDIATSITGASVKRTEHRELIPWTIWFLGVLTGVAWASYTIWLSSSESNRGRLRFKPGYLPVALVAAFGVSYLILKESYIDADVWRPEMGSILTLLFATAATAAGAATTGPLTKAFAASVARKRQRARSRP